MTRQSFVGALGAVGLPLARPVACRAAETYTMRLSVAGSATAVQGLAAVHFAAGVVQRSHGQLKIDVYPNSQLAHEQESIDGLATGFIDFASMSTSWLVQLFPRFQVFDMPFMFKDIATAYRVLDGPIGDEFFANLETRGLVGLGWGLAGFKEIETTTRPVTVPEDMKGLRIRIVSGPVYVAAYQALGAIPVTIDLTEIFTAISQHAIEAIDVPLASFTTSKYYTAVKHVAMANHIFSPLPLMASKRQLMALPPALQKIVKEEGKAVVPFWRSVYARELANAVQTLKDNGVVFTEVQYPAFRKAMDPVYTMFQSKLGADLLDRVSRAANARN